MKHASLFSVNQIGHEKVKRHGKISCKRLELPYKEVEIFLRSMTILVYPLDEESSYNL